jgi:hypothetical protein
MSNFKPDTVTYVVRSELGSRINPEEKGARMDGFSHPQF